VRVIFALFWLVLAAGCFQSSAETAGLGGNDDRDPSAPEGLGGCVLDSDCVLAASTCCGCPTFAVPLGDPLVEACGEVDCPALPPSCAMVEPRCDQGACTLACMPQACEASCEHGYALDTNGCLSCTCAPPPAADGCTRDSECVQTRADCCGCAQGGDDTAVLATVQASHDAMLGCSTAPQCPGVNTCDASERPLCVQGRCELLGDLPAGACGRPDLPACPAGTTCTVNASDQANMHGVGVCATP